MLLQGKCKMQHVFSYTRRLFDYNLLQVLKGQGRNSIGLANVRLNIHCSHILPKSRLNVKLYK